MIKRNMKILVLSFLLFLIPVSNYAQIPDTLWTKMYDVSNDFDEGKCVKETKDGGYIITGTCVPNGMISAIDLALIKTDDAGNLLWTKTYDRHFIEEGLTVEQTFDDGFIIGGRALNVTGPNPSSDHDSQVWILKTDSNGDTLWTKTYGVTGHDYCTSVAQTTDSGYVLVGTKNSKLAYPPNCFLDCNDYYSSRIWMLNTDASGDTLWSKTFITGGYGNCVFIDHIYGYETRYGHMQKILVRQGQKVKRGEKIGLVGQTGIATAPHFAGWLAGSIVDGGRTGPVSGKITGE